MPAAAKKTKAIRSIEIDLFVGCGGLVLGFEQAGFDIVASVGIDPIHSAVHEHNFPYSTTICANVKNLSGTDIRGISNLGDQAIDVVISRTLRQYYRYRQS